MPKKNKKSKIVAVSGGFDPIHVGHVRMFQEAKKLGDKLVVILNNDNWLKRKKGYVFMSAKDRKEIIEALACVDKVHITSHEKNDEDMSVCAELKIIRPHIFANGGDRDRKDSLKKTSSLSPEHKLCKQLGITMKFNVGRGGKIRSSSLLVIDASKKTSKNILRKKKK